VEDDSDTQYRSPVPSGSCYFADHFDDPKTLQTKWVKSEAKKEDTPEELAVYDGEFPYVCRFFVLPNVEFSIILISVKIFRKVEDWST